MLNTCGGNVLSLAGVSVDDVAVIVLSVLSVVNVTLIESFDSTERRALTRGVSLAVSEDVATSDVVSEVVVLTDSIASEIGWVAVSEATVSLVVGVVIVSLATTLLVALVLIAAVVLLASAVILVLPLVGTVSMLFSSA